MSLELYTHLHNRAKKFDKFRLLHNKKSVKRIDKWAMFMGVLSPLTSLPQLVQILETRNADGVSVLTWVLYIVLAVFWLVYGIAHKEKVIIVNNLGWIILELAIVVLTFVY